MISDVQVRISSIRAGFLLRHIAKHGQMRPNEGFWVPSGVRGFKSYCVAFIRRVSSTVEHQAPVL